MTYKCSKSTNPACQSSFDGVNLSTIIMSMTQEGSNNPVTPLYVGDLKPDVTEMMLYQIRPIVSFRVRRDKDTKRS